MSLLFLHYEIEPRILQPAVPFALDVREGKAYVSLVAFTQQKLRLAYGGALTMWAGALVANHSFLNVRTYVREGAEPGIHFIAEWVPNHLATWIAPPLYGLPYRLGTVQFEHDQTGGRLHGQVVGQGGGRLEYRAGFDPACRYQTCRAGSLDDFLLERYVAFTERKSIHRQFRVAHEPWPQTTAMVQTIQDDLLRVQFPWWNRARLAGAYFSPGVAVQIGAAKRLN